MYYLCSNVYSPHTNQGNTHASDYSQYNTIEMTSHSAWCTFIVIFRRFMVRIKQIYARIVAFQSFANAFPRSRRAAPTFAKILQKQAKSKHLCPLTTKHWSKMNKSSLASHVRYNISFSIFRNVSRGITSLSYEESLQFYKLLQFFPLFILTQMWHLQSQIFLLLHII